MLKLPIKAALQKRLLALEAKKGHKAFWARVLAGLALTFGLLPPLPSQAAPTSWWSLLFAVVLLLVALPLVASLLSAFSGALVLLSRLPGWLALTGLFLFVLQRLHGKGRRYLEACRL